jgi:CheY-like chemotaxis protein
MSRIVLLVEDSEQCALTLEIALLAIPGLAVNWLSNGQEALKFLNGDSGGAVCALLTDLNMPRMDGFELIRHVRADGRFHGLPIVVLSADTDPRTPEKVTLLGANAFFPKPFSPAEVRNKLEQLLNASS